MSYIEAYKNSINKLISELSDRPYKEAGEILADTIEHGGLVHIVGTGIHSSMSAEDMFFRTGALVVVNPLFDPTLSVTHSAAKAFYMKNAPDLGTFLMEYYRNISAGDAIIIVDNEGIGTIPYEIIKWSSEKELKIIVVTSIDYANSIDKENCYRNPERINITDMDVSLVIDNKVPINDTAVILSNGMQSGWVSTIANSFILNMVTLSTIECLEDRGIKCDLWHDFITTEGCNRNESFIDKYYERIRHI